MTKALTLKELFDLASKKAAEMFNESESHEVLPMWHAVAGNGDNILIATPWGDDDEKDAAMDALRHLFQKHQVKRFAFVSEVWVAAATTEHDMRNGPRPSEHPDRREGLMIRAEDRDGSMLCGMYYILRPEHGPPKLSDFKTHDYDQMTGRMVGLLT